MNPAATSDPTRETTAMMIETMSTIFAVDFDICENHVVERIVGRLSPQRRVWRMLWPERNLAWQCRQFASWIQQWLGSGQILRSEEFLYCENLTPRRQGVSMQF